MILKHNNFIPQANSPLIIWLKYIQNTHNKEIDLSLDRVKKVAKYLNLLEKRSVIFFTVAGTNGKGTTCRLIEQLLLSFGYKTGLYSSPHLRKYTERIRINGYELPHYYHSISLNIIEKNRKNISLTYFEYTTLSALMLFKQANLDVIILEVGLGGLYDATNIIDPDISIITNIDIDHTDILSNDIEKIGKEKAGILRYKTLGIVSNSITNSVLLYSQKIKANLLQQNKDWFFFKNKKNWIFKDLKGKLANLPFTKIPLSNAAIAIAALRSSNLLKIKKNEKIFNQINNINLSGRFHIFEINNFFIILDVAHNPHSASYLSRNIAKFFSKKKKNKLYAIIGMLKNKDIYLTVKCLINQVDYWYCVNLPCDRSAINDEIIKYLPKKQSKKFSNINKAYFYALKNIKKKDVLLVFGSFYTVSSVLNLIDYQIKKSNINN